MLFCFCFFQSKEIDLRSPRRISSILEPPKIDFQKSKGIDLWSIDLRSPRDIFSTWGTSTNRNFVNLICVFQWKTRFSSTHKNNWTLTSSYEHNCFIVRRHTFMWKVLKTSKHWIAVFGNTIITKKQKDTDISYTFNTKCQKRLVIYWKIYGISKSYKTFLLFMFLKESNNI